MSGSDYPCHMRGLIFITGVLCSLLCFGQFNRLIISGGGNWSKIKSDNLDFEGAFGLNFGLNGVQEIDDKLDWSLGLSLRQNRSVWDSELVIYNENGERTGTEDFDLKFNLTYVSIPVVIRYAIIEKLSLDAGAEIDYLIADKVESQNPNNPGTLDVPFNKINFGVIAGIMYSSSKYGLRFSAKSNFLNLTNEENNTFGSEKLPICIGLDLIAFFEIKK